MTDKPAPPNRLISSLIREPDHHLDNLVRSVIGAAIEVHRHLGPGLSEPLYAPALHVELAIRRIPFESEVILPVSYKGHPLGKRKIDLLVDKRLIVEIKSVEALAPIHTAQLICYLRLTGKQLGLLINFNVPLLKDGVKRVVLS
ncbi:MAG TPA: GxxExxY protein [Pyrinomonadaceae bacterium]|nr:GxxExxY protein [Pyrinomonadaceae bacterium]